MTTPSTLTPNLYRLRGQDLQVMYWTFGIDGRPLFQYRDSSQTLEFSGDEIRTLESEIGTLVTVTIRPTIDTGSTSFTVVIPQVHLDQSKQDQITTFGVTTVHRLSPIPIFNQGQRELYTITELSGTAAFTID
jgi:hypothetical protein